MSLCKLLWVEQPWGMASSLNKNKLILHGWCLHAPVTTSQRSSCRCIRSASSLTSPLRALRVFVLSHRPPVLLPLPLQRCTTHLCLLDPETSPTTEVRATFYWCELLQGAKLCSKAFPALVTAAFHFTEITKPFKHCMGKPYLSRLQIFAHIK